MYGILYLENEKNQELKYVVKNIINLEVSVQDGYLLYRNWK